MDDVTITFFMIVTDRDIVIADRAVRSYASIKDLRFRLLVYSNWISSGLKAAYFPRWRALGYVDIIENQWQTDDNKPTDRSLWGPFELGATIWDRELKRIASPFVATVDADFEILDPSFINTIIREMDADPSIGAFSSDYTPLQPSVFDSYSNEVIRLNERWHTWFCVYRREALQAPVSHAYHEEIVPGPVARNAWDDAGFLQKFLRESLHYRMRSLEPRYQKCFVHYGQFSHNRIITERNVDLYRRIRRVRKVGLLGRYDLIARGAAIIAEKLLFRGADRSTYFSGWAQKTS